jgi:hypothetical protein
MQTSRALWLHCGVSVPSSRFAPPPQKQVDLLGGVGHVIEGHDRAAPSLAWLQLGDGKRRRLVDRCLTATFGFKDRYSDQEIEAVCKELDEAEQPGAIPPSTGSGG